MNLHFNADKNKPYRIRRLSGCGLHGAGATYKFLVESFNVVRRFIDIHSSSGKLKNVRQASIEHFKHSRHLAAEVKRIRFMT